MFVEARTLGLLGPEILLTAIATLLFVGGAFVRQREAWSLVALVSYVVAGIWLFTTSDGSLSVTSGPVTSNGMSVCLRMLAIVLGITFTLVASQQTDKLLATEYLGSLMLIVVGLMIVAAANELVLLFLGFELISIPTYVLLFLGRRDRVTSEATMKYFFLSILSSALLLFGLAFLFGMAGTTTIQGTAAAPGIREVLQQLSATDSISPLKALLPLAPLALVFILAGLGFKLTAAPFHFYAPDVYQGTTNSNAGLLAVAPKIAGVVGLVRLVIIALPISADFAWQLALVLSVITMTLGNVCALWQRNVRRLMAYSSIAHGGYLLLGLAAATGSTALPQLNADGGTTAIIFYVVVYSLASMGTFTALAYLGSHRRDLQTVDELAGLGKSQPLAAAVIAVCMFSLAGLPPLAGFWGKFSLFTSALQIALGNSGNISFGFILLLVVGALNAAIAAAYYLRLVSVMFFQPAVGDDVPAAGGYGALAASVLCGALVVLAGVAPGPILRLAGQSEEQMLKVTVTNSAPVSSSTQVEALAIQVAK
ncbi:NADH-quinone oxidoreductase subunit N [Anatilimnocola aggregata]|uniref:NADH-quinone oxidoreductase subunit N n=1 Tax=Anatilimnocola aggregata TaxID=2528021 RepID=A0A517YAB5_9BACT|nr:NADH-quinone oxidoreductase subunit N [Anatilimnocola aggregata]QDU27102.1 NADH-quinone oxidoreductase subunit N [Anatilimnocola aggregata]